MGLGSAFSSALEALSRGAYETRQFQKLGPDFRNILAKQELERRKLETEIPSPAEEAAHEQQAVADAALHQQEALKGAVTNAANMEPMPTDTMGPNTTITGMGNVGTAPKPTMVNEPTYAAPPGLGVTDEAFASMAHGARTERKSSLAYQKALQDFQMQNLRNQGGIDRVHAAGGEARTTEGVKQQDRIEIMGKKFVKVVGPNSKPQWIEQGKAEGMQAPAPDVTTAGWKPATDEMGNLTGDLVNTRTGETKSAPALAGMRTSGLTGTTATQTHQAGNVTTVGQDLLDTLPQVADKIGPLLGRGVKLEQLMGNPDPEVQQFATQLASFAALQPGLHGFRGQRALQEFERLLGGTEMTPEALAGGIKGFMRTATLIGGTARPKGPAKTTHGAPVARRAKPGGGYEFKDAQGNVWSE